MDMCIYVFISKCHKQQEKTWGFSFSPLFRDQLLFFLIFWAIFFPAFPLLTCACLSKALLTFV